MDLKRIWFQDNRLYGEFADGEILWQSLLYYPRLMNASMEDREVYELDSDGVYWPLLDEDVSSESFGFENPEPTGLSLLLLSHPELNYAALSKMTGIDTLLITRYAMGLKQPSKEHETLIRNAFVEIGKGLCAINS